MTPDARARLQHNVRMAGWWRLAGQTETLDHNGRPVDVWTLRTPQPPAAADGGGDTPLTAGVSDGGRGPVETPPCLPVPATTTATTNRGTHD